LQPLDVVVFQPYKHYYAEAVDQVVRLGDATFNKIKFLAVFQGFRTKAFKQLIFRSSFRKTGLIPYNSEVVLASLRKKKYAEDNKQSKKQMEAKKQ